LIAGCSHGGPPGGEPPLGPIPTVRTVTDIAFPLDAYSFTPDQRETVIYATQLLTQQCALRFGVDYKVSPPPYDQPTYADTHARRFGIFQLEQAQQYGYNPPPDPDQDANRGKGAGGWNPGPYELLVVVGHGNSSTADKALPVDDQGVTLDEDGCSGWADRTLRAGAPDVDDIAVLNDANASVYDSKKDSRVQAAFHAWSTCMADQGYHYDDPWQPNNKEWPEPPDDEEIATAVADVTCKQQTNLVGIWLAVETAYENRAIEQHAEQLRQVKDLLDAELRNANDVLAGKQ